MPRMAHGQRGYSAFESLYQIVIPLNGGVGKPRHLGLTCPAGARMLRGNMTWYSWGGVP